MFKIILLLIIFNLQCATSPGAKKFNKYFKNKKNCKIILNINGELAYHFPISDKCGQQAMKIGYYYFNSSSETEPYLNLISSDSGMFKIIFSQNYNELILIDARTNKHDIYQLANGE
ncbi:hypothetical protein EHQ47_16710 [Leptospira bourretii]|uniref:hypothetical protein n=1 Tax=Leptospira bourretii TaxID=2484962 RepID=UPI00109146D3|nr:hypothetical protein [Leptospira bourretii]TGL19737.1 hypothetical protein EHQ47_16710 [Leptospira bourretii]